MNADGGLGAGEERVAHLLREYFLRRRFEDCVENGQIDRLGADAPSDPESRARREAHLAVCEDCRSVELAAARGLLAVPTLPRADARQPRAARTPRMRRVTAFMLAAGLAGSVAGAAYLATSAGDAGRREEPGSAFTPKGASDVVAVPEEQSDQLDIAVLRDGLVFRAVPGDRLLAGDQLRLFHTSRAAGYLRVLNVDAAGHQTTLFPHADDGAIAAGDDIALAGGVLVGPASGCEWIVGVFSDAPLSADAIRDGIARPIALDAQACHLDVAVAGARNVIVIPARR